MWSSPYPDFKYNIENAALPFLLVNMAWVLKGWKMLGHIFHFGTRQSTQPLVFCHYRKRLPVSKNVSSAEMNMLPRFMLQVSVIYSPQCFGGTSFVIC